MEWSIVIVDVSRLDLTYLRPQCGMVWQLGFGCCLRLEDAQMFSEEATEAHIKVRLGRCLRRWRNGLIVRTNHAPV